MLRIPSEVAVKDRHSLYSAVHKFTAFYDESALRSNYPVPFNVFCEPCQQMCAIDSVTQPSHTRFWCAGEFAVKSSRNPDSKTRCNFSITYTNPIKL